MRLLTADIRKVDNSWINYMNRRLVGRHWILREMSSCTEDRRDGSHSLHRHACYRIWTFGVTERNSYRPSLTMHHVPLSLALRLSNKPPRFTSWHKRYIPLITKCLVLLTPKCCWLALIVHSSCQERLSFIGKLYSA